MNSLLLLSLIFVVLSLTIAGKAGLRNLLALLYNFAAIFVLILLLSWGFPPVPVTCILSLFMLALLLFMSSTENNVIAIAFKASFFTLLGILVLALFAQFFGQFQGFASENAEALEELSLSVGLDFSGIATSVMILSSLGAIAEAAMAVTEDLTEITLHTPNLTLSALTNERKIVSQQILGTAVNTLFFGLLGSSVSLILWFVKLHYTLAEIFNSKLLLLDVTTMLLGMLGLLAVILLSGHFVLKNFRETQP
ncbi:MAG: YibE/F family protein [Streptococcaceae bacterium]|jgi:uncharacterized membrane protein|nr:YibE/F family protein [Streptococcaceae bacterium]